VRPRSCQALRLFYLAKIPIHAHKGLVEGQHILDYMGSEELGANIFGATRTDAKLRRENITGKAEANRTHYEMGQKVRKFIEQE
jgi:DNA-damage-inducible protein D